MKRLLVLLCAVLALMMSCDAFDFGPYNVLPGQYVRNLGDGYTDLAIVLEEDGSCHVTQYDIGSTEPSVDLDTEYTYSYSSFSFDLVTGTLKIEDFGEFRFRWYSNRDAFQYLELLDTSTGLLYTMVYGMVL